MNYERLYEADQWFEELGNCLWWNIPVAEAPYVGTPLDNEFDPLYLTHFSILPAVKQPNGEQIRGGGYLKYIKELNKPRTD